MADERPIQQAASAEMHPAGDPSSPVQLELRAPWGGGGIIAAELTRIRFEMTAIRKILQGRESIEVEELKRLQGAREHRGRDL